MRNLNRGRLIPRPDLARYGLILAVALAGACQSQPGKQSAAPTRAPAAATTKKLPNSNTDPCAMRLHDICGALFMYYAIHHDLPAKVEDLAEVPGFENVRDFTCPASGRAYIYNPIGVVSTGGASARLIIYDPSPVHAEMRWAISVIEPKDPNAALIAKVVALPESNFSLSAPAAAPGTKTR